MNTQVDVAAFDRHDRLTGPPVETVRRNVVPSRHGCFLQDAIACTELP
jgi:hypothetical protein